MTGPLDDAEELLFRQVHPSFVRDGRPSSQAFRPTKKDEKKLSVARGALTDAKAAYELHVGAKKAGSVGTWGVTVGECLLHGLSTFEDPVLAADDQVEDVAHAVVDFSPLTSNGQIEAKASQLTRLATARGKLYPTDGES